MSLNWNLQSLYESFGSEAFQNDLVKLDDNLIECINWINEVKLKNGSEGNDLLETIKKIENIYKLKDKLNGFVLLKISTDSKDQDALKYSDLIDKKLNVLSQINAKMSKLIKKVKNLDDIIKNTEELYDYDFYLRELYKKSQYSLSEKEEIAISKMKSTGSNSWVNYKNLLISTHKVELELDGKIKTLPLTAVLNFKHSSKEKVRKEGYRAELESYKKIEDGVAAALNSIKGEVINISQMRGYDSPLDMTLKNSKMKQETLDAMFKAIKENLVIFRKYLKRKAEYLGYKNGLPFFELQAPVIDEEIEFDYESAKEYVIKNFGSFSKELAQFAKHAFENNWIDVMPKEGKTGGAFCCNLRSIGESRIMLNFSNSLSGVITLSHELGHGFHGKCLIDQSCINAIYPMPLAETASTFCEMIVKKAAIKKVDKKEAFSILEKGLVDDTQVIVDIYSRFLFEKEFFKKRIGGPLSVEEIKEIMVKSQKDSYGDGLDPDYLHPYMWTWKPHYYDPDLNFYNFPYAFGSLFAKGLYYKYINEGEKFVGKYKYMLSVCGKKNIEDVAKIMDIDVCDIEFWRSSLAFIKEDIEKFIKLSYEIYN